MSSVFFVLFVCLHVSVFSLISNYFLTFGGPEYDTVSTIIEASDGSHVILGHSYNGGGSSDIIIAKFSLDGIMVWAKFLGDQSYYVNGFSSLFETSDGGFVLAGGYKSSYFWLLHAKLFSNGTLDWANKLGGALNTEAIAVRATGDGGSVVTGYTENDSAGDTDLLLAKFFIDGTLDWAKTFGGIGKEGGNDVIEASDGEYVVSGYTHSFGEGFSNLLLVKFDAAGNVTWANILGGSGLEVGRSVKETNDGGFIVNGLTNSFGTGGNTVLIAKFYSNGSLEWVRGFGGNDTENAYSLVATIDGFLIAGSTNSFTGGSYYDAFLTKLYYNGSLDWTETLGGLADDHGYSVQEVSTGLYLFAGHTSTFGAGLFDIFLSYHRRGDGCYWVEQNFLEFNGSSTMMFSSLNITSVDAESLSLSSFNLSVGEIGSWNVSSLCIRCSENYFGEFCNVTMCDGVFSNQTNVCNGNGTCEDYNQCECKKNEYYGEFCEQSIMCYGKLFSDDNICSGKGECAFDGNCTCESDYYTGLECEIWSCFNYSRNDVDEVCGGHGACIGKDSCFCLDGYEAEYAQGPCVQWYCGKYKKDESEVCNGRGECYESNKCQCRDAYEGDLCESWSCGYPFDSPLTCNGNGECVSPDTCECIGAYKGEQCETFAATAAIVVPLVLVSGISLVTFLGISFSIICCTFFCGICVFFFCMCFLCIFLITLYSRVKKFGKLKNFGMFCIFYL